ncbi:hypothetical protein ABID30_000968 [Enterococcus rotai]|uniref:Uncharacterized protein n=1 Tax=Enterococcus rotai TaxID=118060 RepID=A0A0U2X852_9ENTE|nr:hypothetical protein [Enterococcus rotai]ALS36280.1 hypothetical protein ATZ35_03600 [Enterococcus rotai]
MVAVMKPLAKIEFTFLEKQKDVQNWDNTFYELFSMFHEMESQFSPPNSDVNDRFIMLTSTNIYVKKYQEKKIQVYHNMSGKYKNIAQLYLFSAYEREETSLLIQLIEEIQSHLENSDKKYTIQNERHTSLDLFSDAKPYLSLEIT